MMLTRNQISVFLALSVAFWVVLLRWRGVPVTKEMLLPFSGVVGAVSLVLLIFDRWAWHWILFRGWLVKKPYVHGTWRAELLSDWIDPATQRPIGLISGYMVIRQTFSTLTLRLLTKESRSESVSSGIEVCPDGTFEINSAYRNKPKAAYRHRSEVHYGALLLQADTAMPDTLEGEYWTDRKSLGSISLSDHKSKICGTYHEAERLFQLKELT